MNFSWKQNPLTFKSFVSISALEATEAILLNLGHIKRVQQPLTLKLCHLTTLTKVPCVSAAPTEHVISDIPGYYGNPLESSPQMPCPDSGHVTQGMTGGDER